ncbi:MAG: hypothetical protein E7290_12195 [Lachnospiraceae bacterium]|nr:hypothetical protein [Lachnospiraceae bacterium]
MKTYIFLYQEISLFEVDLVAYFLKTKGDVYIVTDGDEVIHTNEGIRVLADKKLEEVTVDDVDVLVICGGNIENIKDMQAIQKVVKDCKTSGKVVGGICAGSRIVAEALGVDTEVDRTVVYDNQVVLSPGNEYVDFALMMGKAADIYEDEADYEETVQYFKQFHYLG